MRSAAWALPVTLLFVACSPSSGVSPQASTSAPPVASPSSSAVSEQPCAVDHVLLERIYRGFHPKHSEDVTIVPKEPNYWGWFDYWSHSGPWDYLQNVPLVLYGPGRIAAAGSIDDDAHITDVYPTIDEILTADLRERRGLLLDEALVPERTTTDPKLIVSIMWDGVGRNMLERWPDRWPNLARLETEGTSYITAEVGSSPSITPASHASLGTGSYPNEHGVTAIDYRVDKDTVRTAFAYSDPKDLKLTTYADQIDKFYGNRSKVGLIGWRDWHVPMLGHGAMTPGGDKDELALIGETGRVTGNRDFYRTPSYLKHHEELLLTYASQLDREDGEVDFQWRGHDIMGAYDDNPAFVRYQGDLAMKMLKRGAYGLDDVPDLWFANFKMTDIAAHQYALDSLEVAEDLEVQDEQLGRILDYLDRKVKDYVVILTADHGHTPKASTTGGWPISPSEARDDIFRAFDVPMDAALFASTTAVGLFLNRDVAKEHGVTPRELAGFLEDYTIRQNWPDGEGSIPDGYRGSARVFSAAWAAADFEEIMSCAFGPTGEPPPRRPS